MKRWRRMLKGPATDKSCYMMEIDASMWAWGKLNWPLSECRVGFYLVAYVIRGRDEHQHEQLIQDEILTMYDKHSNDYANFK